MSKKKVIVCAVIIVSLAFLGYNAIWYFGTYRVYSQYEKEFEEVADSGVKIFVDDAEYQYSVKKPGYLLWDGNLAISEKNVEHALIIWVGFCGNNTSEGVIFTNENGEMLQIELKNKSLAVEPYNQEYVDNNSEIISKLYEKANNQWNLEIE